MALETGRFNVVKQVPASVRRSDTYNAVTSQQFREYLGEHNLHAEMRRLFRWPATVILKRRLALPKRL
jgi:hypothetical protein